MKRPVFGIIAMFCLQLGFIAYNAIDRPSDALVAVNEVVSGTNPIADVPNILNGVDDEEFSVSPPESRKSRRPNVAAFVYIKHIAKVSTTRPINAAPQYVALQKPLETTIRIEYPKAMPIVSKSENYQPSSPIAPRSEKRSFVSKSFSVLKKPYDWLKALGSRIN